MVFAAICDNLLTDNMPAKKTIISCGLFLYTWPTLDYEKSVQPPSPQNRNSQSFYKLANRLGFPFSKTRLPASKRDDG